MIVHCNQRICKWNKDGYCDGPKQPSGEVALYISGTLGGQAICTDMEYKEGWEDDDA